LIRIACGDDDDYVYIENKWVTTTIFPMINMKNPKEHK
jgi:hypothetical protein